MFDALTNLFGGGQSRGYEDMINSLRQGMGASRGEVDRANSVLDPLANMSMQQLQDYINSYQKMANPKGFMDEIMNKYEESPWAKIMTKRGTDAAEAAAGRSGTLGSTGYSNQISQFASDTAKTDMQNYLNNILGINSQKLGHQSNLLGMTNPAIYQKSNNIMGLAQMLPQMYGNIGQAQLGQRMAQSEGIGGLLRMAGNFMPGGQGMAGMGSQLFGRGSYA